MVSFFKEGRNFDCILFGVNAVTKAIHGEFNDDETPSGNPFSSLIAMFIIFLILILILYISSRRKGRMITGDTIYDDPYWPYDQDPNNGHPRTRRRNNGPIIWGGPWGGGSSGSSGGGWDGGSFGGGGFGGGGGGASW